MPNLETLKNPTDRVGNIFTIARGAKRMILLAPLGQEARKYMRAGDTLQSSAPATRATFAQYGLKPMRKSAHLLAH